jgi:hypothetical protein
VLYELIQKDIGLINVIQRVANWNTNLIAFLHNLHPELTFLVLKIFQEFCIHNNSVLPNVVAAFMDY